MTVFCVCGLQTVRVWCCFPDGLVAGHWGLGLRLDVIGRHHRFHVHRPRKPFVLQAPHQVWSAAEIRAVSLCYLFISLQRLFCRKKMCHILLVELWATIQN